MVDLSQIFDSDYYSALYPDLGSAGLVNQEQLFNHFIQSGIDENRSFSPLIELNYYQSVNPDLSMAGLNTNRQLIDHIINFGINEKRRFSPNIDLNFYASANPDLIAAGLNSGAQLFDHLINLGVREGRPLVAPPVSLPEVTPPQPQLPTDDPDPGIPDVPDFPEFPDLLGGFLTTRAFNSDSSNLALNNGFNNVPGLTGLNSAVTASWQIAVSYLQKFLIDPDFATKITTAFGQDANFDLAKSFVEDLIGGQTAPTIHIVSLDELAGAQGAFDLVTNTIYLSQEFIVQHATTPENIASVILEEVGHYIDAQINSVDAPGDEGAIFSDLVRGIHLSDEALGQLKSNEDWGTLQLGDFTIPVERSKRWSLWTYDLNNFQGWNRFVGSTTVNSNSTGINLDWGFDSADKFNSVYLGNQKDNFVALVGTFAHFEAGKSYTFKANGDDSLFLMAQPQSNRNNYSWITPQWEVFDHGQGRPADKTYNFTAKESGWHTVYAGLIEKGGRAYIDVNWQPSDGRWTIQANKNGERRPIHIQSIDGQPITDKPTWLVIHGNANSASHMENLAKAIKSNQPNAQVLTLDWGSAANNVSFGDEVNRALQKSTEWIQPVAQAAKNLLTDFGISNKNINLVGHSLGTYVSWEISKSIPQGVNKIIALDPATQIPGWYKTKNINFSEYSDWSWAFKGSAFGDDTKAGTADEFFQMAFPSLNPDTNHRSVHEAFAALLYQNNSLWSLNQMKPSGKLWNIDYGPKAEAFISFYKNGSQWQISQWRDDRGALIAS
ncbi:hypothetical protein [Laspinema olomoucense]|uniref:Lipase domain-containing protein n=1 Tax=Laspinema olomoucense D3b TaxID=2953688 RepID=A0ABT2N450_9CYAN|nr:hypothetical protein [Laspinema sp. D3b]MCT7977433.1 hypothetical protein [Laspinema sp. D3b]